MELIKFLWPVNTYEDIILFLQFKNLYFIFFKLVPAYLKPLITQFIISVASYR